MTESSYDDRDGTIWMDGTLRPWRDAKLHVLSHALHYASCVFEGERAYNGRIFKSKEHSERLITSAVALDFELPYSIEQLEAAKSTVMQSSGLQDAYIRAVAWRGSEQMGVDGRDNTIHVAIAAWAWGAYYGDARDKGLRLDMAKWRRPSPETIPCKAKAAGLYMICSLSKHAAAAKGYGDAMMLDYRGYIAEATGANIFFYKDGIIHTPKPDCFLNGITRQTVIGLIKARGIDVIERHILPEELADFEQCFLTGTAAEVTPVCEIGKYTFEIGSLIKDLLADYDTVVRST